MENRRIDWHRVNDPRSKPKKFLGSLWNEFLKGAAQEAGKLAIGGAVGLAIALAFLFQ